MDPSQALGEIAFWLERAGAATHRIRAFRRAARVVVEHAPDEVRCRARAGRLTELAGIGPITASVIEQAEFRGTVEYLERLRAEAVVPRAGRSLRAALRADCHVHSDWSDGSSSIEGMAETARWLGHEWVACTDHSPRLTIARGLSADRLREQLRLIGERDAGAAPMRIATGIEVDILEDGQLDQDDAILEQLDIVVASVHSRLRMDRAEMTRRMCRAVSHPCVDVLGHPTGRLLADKKRSPSTFDAEAVFNACRQHGVAVEINSRPERLDPPRELLRLAHRLGCVFAIDSDAHAPGQLDWLAYGCARAEECGIGPDRVINTMAIEELRRARRFHR